MSRFTQLQAKLELVVAGCDALAKECKRLELEALRREALAISKALNQRTKAIIELEKHSQSQ